MQLLQEALQMKTLFACIPFLFCLSEALASSGAISPISPDQKDRIDQEMKKNVGNPELLAAVIDATPSIKPFLEMLSCVNDYTGTKALNAYATAGIDLSGPYVMLRPMRATTTHNKATCLTVTRIHGWTAPTKNSLKFEVVYTADDSGEVAKTKHEVIKQPDGSWLFSNETY
jgi:hypothetical protein